MERSEEMNDFSREHLSMNGNSTDLITFGPGLFELSDMEPEKLPKTLILMIPGNPGVIQYYEEFMRCLFNSFEGKYPVWGISHGGHSRAPDHEKLPISNTVDLGNLDGQIKHKKYFINDFIPATVRLVLIGHSIGAYMTLELLKHLPKDRVEKAILLFPTIERMAISPNGKWATPLLTYFQFLPISFAYLSSFLSNEFKLKLIRWYIKGSNVPECAYKATLDLFEPSVIRASMRLAKDEMDKVVDINSEAVLANQDKLIFYYGVTDQWCPVSYYQDTKNRFPDVEAWLCEEGIEHAFVLRSNREMADKVFGWLKEKLI